MKSFSIEIELIKVNLVVEKILVFYGDINSVTLYFFSIKIQFYLDKTN